MPAMMMAHEVDPREKILGDVGDLSSFDICHNQVLCAVYIRPERTKSGLILADQTRDEDRNQSKVGLILKKGPTAFVGAEDDVYAWPQDMTVGDWIYYRASDGWATTLVGHKGEKILCRVLDDTRIRGRVPFPDMVW